MAYLFHDSIPVVAEPSRTPFWLNATDLDVARKQRIACAAETTCAANTLVSYTTKRNSISRKFSNSSTNSLALSARSRTHARNKPI
jgi:hypothetical protein